jgi:hypothetical protein
MLRHHLECRSLLIKGTPFSYKPSYPSPRLTPLALPDPLRKNPTLSRLLSLPIVIFHRHRVALPPRHSHQQTICLNLSYRLLVLTKLPRTLIFHQILCPTLDFQAVEKTPSDKLNKRGRKMASITTSPMATVVALTNMQATMCYLSFPLGFETPLICFCVPRPTVLERLVHLPGGFQNWTTSPQMFSEVFQPRQAMHLGYHCHRFKSSRTITLPAQCLDQGPEPRCPLQSPNHHIHCARGALHLQFQTLPCYATTRLFMGTAPPITAESFEFHIFPLVHRRPRLTISVEIFLCRLGFFDLDKHQ